MTAATLPVSEPRNYLNDSYSIKSCLLTTDHKRVAILYLISTTLMSSSAVSSRS